VQIAGGSDQANRNFSVRREKALVHSG
jgi:hypothetical protein